VQGNFINTTDGAGNTEIASKREELDSVITLQSTDWKRFMNFEVRITICHYFEKTNETDIYIHLNLDGTGKAKSKLESLLTHAGPNCPSWTNGLRNSSKGDLVDEHHTIEDTAIALGEVLPKHWVTN
jgi:imidazoleglycerol-phosphate dehydratase/histidinol-phosphatase